MLLGLKTAKLPH